VEFGLEPDAIAEVEAGVDAVSAEAFGGVVGVAVLKGAADLEVSRAGGGGFGLAVGAGGGEADEAGEGGSAAIGAGLMKWRGCAWVGVMISP
jgi:hypothetical protein